MREKNDRNLKLKARERRKEKILEEGNENKENNKTKEEEEIR
jgi:hypothetical protein